jgi:pimeloyl-ACP methyl ester carboxylesterase
MVDVTPGVNSDKARHITAFVAGPPSFRDLDEIVARTVAHNPGRSEQSLRRGVLHNAVQRDDGTWVWRHQRHEGPQATVRLAPEDLWDALSSVKVPVLLVRAMGAGSVVDDEDEAEFLRRQPGATIARVDQSGHSVQGDQPIALAQILGDFLDA